LPRKCGHLCFGYLDGKQKEEFVNAFSEEYMDIIELRNYSIESLVKQHILPSLTRKIDAFLDYVKGFIKNQQPNTSHSSNK
jgi:hypothetical protein